MTLQPGRHRVLIVNLPQTPYPEALELQHRLVAAKTSGALQEDVLLLLEHPPVVTLGRRGGAEFLSVSEAWLNRHGITVIQTGRGGFITYHGPGQLVGYPIFDLDRLGLGVASLVNGIEDVMIRTAGDWHVTAGQNPRNRGVWVETRKLGSIGLAVRRAVSFHGFAFNADLDLTPFEWITPCGLPGVKMTSLKNETGVSVDMKALRKAVAEHFAQVFRFAPEAADLQTLEAVLMSRPDVAGARP